MPTTPSPILQEILTDSPVQSTAADQLEVSDIVAYIEAELDGHNAAQLYPLVQRILENSLACRQEYGEVKELLQRERSGQWQEPPRAAQFDFSYLTAKPPAEVIEEQPFWSFDASGRLFIFFPVERIQLVGAEQAKTEFALLRAEEGPATLFFEKIATGQDLDIELTVRAATAASAQCTLVVNVNIPSRGGWPNLADSAVTLQHAQQTWPMQLTDEFGIALFDGLPLKNLTGLTIVVEPSPTTH